MSATTPTATNALTCRQEFEAWAKTHRLMLDTVDGYPGLYMSTDVRNAWERWLDGKRADADLLDYLADELKAAAAPATNALAVDATSTLRDAVHAALHDELAWCGYDCTRVWEAWGLGTMHESDFTPISNRLDDITDSVMRALAAATPPAAEAEHPAETALRNIALAVGVGGFNSPVVDAAVFEAKILVGIHDLVGLRAAEAEQPVDAQAASPDDLRALGWSVAVHNDYRLNGNAFTFWLLTKDGLCIKGEGPSDAAALNAARASLASRTPPPAQPVAGRVYLGGPMTGLPERNFPTFHAEAARLRALGLDIVSPAELCADIAGQWGPCLRRDIAALMTCEGLALLPGWQASKGARLEWHNAVELGMPIEFLNGAEAAPPAEALGDRSMPLASCNTPPAGWACSRGAGHPGPCAATQVAQPANGIELAARWVQKRLDDYDSAAGSTDPDTGTREYPGDGEEYVGELTEIIEGIRALATRPPATHGVGDAQ